MGLLSLPLLLPELAGKCIFILLCSVSDCVPSVLNQLSISSPDRHQEAVASLLGGGNKNPEPLTLLTAAQILLAAGEVNIS